MSIPVNTWYCNYCNFYVFNSKSKCNKCSSLKPKLVITPNTPNTPNTPTYEHETSTPNTHEHETSNTSVKAKICEYYAFPSTLDEYHKTQFLEDKVSCWVCKKEGRIFGKDPMKSSHNCWKYS